jgi:hypothetical protein
VEIVESKEVESEEVESKEIKKEVNAIKKRAIMTVMFWWLKTKKTLIIVLINIKTTDL